MKWTVALVMASFVMLAGPGPELRAQGCSGGSYGYGYAPPQAYYSPPSYYGYYNPPPAWSYGYGYQPEPSYGYYAPQFQQQAWQQPHAYNPSPWASSCPGGVCPAPTTRYRGIAVSGFRSR